MNKTKKSNILAFWFALITAFFSFSYGSTESSIANSSRSISEKVSEQNKEKFFYNKGVTDGFAEGKRVGYEEAMKDAKASLDKYTNYIKSLESGKYLSQKGKITPPRIYQEKRADGSISVVVKGCNIEGELSPKDILMFPALDSIGGATADSGMGALPAGKAVLPSDSVYLAGVDYSKKAKPTDGMSAKKTTFKTFVDNEFYRKLFRGAGLAFSIQPNSKIRVMFSSSEEADNFMNRYGLIEGKDYK